MVCNVTVQEQAHKAYLKGLKYKEIAEQLGISINTVRSWQRRFKWSRKKCAPKEKDVHIKNSGAQAENTNSLYCGAPKCNRNAVKHGLLAKYLPDEIMGIVTDLEDVSHIDILWQNILIQHAKIIHAQKVLFVQSNESHVEVKEKQTSVTIKADGSKETSIVSQSSILAAQSLESKAMSALSRAMGTLNNMIKQYDELCRSDLATEEQRLRIEKVKADITQMAVRNNSVDVDMTNYVAALNPVADDVWSDDNDGITEE